MRVLALADFEAFPWMPIVAGAIEGLEAHGCTVELMTLGRFQILEHWHIARRPFDLAVVFPHHDHLPRLLRVLELLRAQNVKVCSLQYDDPFDMRSGLEVAPLVDLVVTPEALAADGYANRGHAVAVLPPVVSGTLHEPQRSEPFYDVFFVGHAHWSPRDALLPLVRAFCSRNGLRYGEACGKTRWIGGAELGRVLAQTRLTLEIPRTWSHVATNPFLFPCTYTSPRVHIAAATRTPCLVVGGGASDGVLTQFPRCAPGEMLAMLERLLIDDAGAAWRDGSALAAFNEWRDCYAPKPWARALLAELTTAGLRAGAHADQPAAVR